MQLPHRLLPYDQVHLHNHQYNCHRNLRRCRLCSPFLCRWVLLLLLYSYEQAFQLILFLLKAPHYIPSNIQPRHMYPLLCRLLQFCFLQLHLQEYDRVHRHNLQCMYRRNPRRCRLCSPFLCRWVLLLLLYSYEQAFQLILFLLKALPYKPSNIQPRHMSHLLCRLLQLCFLQLHPPACEEAFRYPHHRYHRIQSKYMFLFLFRCRKALLLLHHYTNVSPLHLCIHQHTNSRKLSRYELNNLFRRRLARLQLFHMYEASFQRFPEAQILFYRASSCFPLLIPSWYRWIQLPHQLQAYARYRH